MQKYSTATQITPENVGGLKKAWDIHTGDVSSGPHETSWGATPLFVNNTVYVGTPKGRIFAVEPDTGKQKWIYAAGGAQDPVDAYKAFRGRLPNAQALLRKRGLAETPVPN